MLILKMLNIRYLLYQTIKLSTSSYITRYTKVPGTQVPGTQTHKQDIQDDVYNVLVRYYILIIDQDEFIPFMPLFGLNRFKPSPKLIYAGINC